MSDLSCKNLSILAIVGLVLQIIGLSIFLFAFFPLKPALSGLSGAESFGSPRFYWVRNDSDRVRDLSPDELRSLYEGLSGIAPSYDQLVLMVIDGLPAEFVLGKDGKPPRRELVEAMPYTQSLLEKGMAIGYHAKAAPPTVTMPRLKAMVSGAIGGFLDVAFNFNTQALLDDNLVGQFFKIGWRMVMLGDETWLKLFPGLFTRHDGVSSFFVKDTVKVDQNVSRHLPQELSRHDWDLLILHYLGLDHVGHIGGRNSILMAPKLVEMDEVIKMIHTRKILNRTTNHGKTLLLVVSDHGMTESGNHGGSSYEETDSLALFIGLENDVSGSVLSKKTVHQVDIAPTLALLFGVPIPKNNVGILISESFEHLSDEQKLRALELNSLQLLRLLQAQIPSLSCGSLMLSSSTDKASRATDCKGSMEETFCCLYENALFLHHSWVSNNISSMVTSFDRVEEFHAAVGAYNEFLRTASEWLSRRVTYKPINLLALGVTAMLLSCLIFLSLLYFISKGHKEKKKRHCNSENKPTTTWHLDEAFTVAVIFIFVLSMGSSSMVEEEQYIWHFVTSTLTLLLLRKATQSLQVGRSHSLFSLINFKEMIETRGFQTSTVALLLVSERILRGWHQGGVNWTDLPDISKWLEQSGSHYVKSIHLVTGFLIISVSLFSLAMSEIGRRFKAVLGFFCVAPGLLILRHILEHQNGIILPSSYSATTLVQTIYMILGLSTFCTAAISSWLSPLLSPNTSLYSNSNKSPSDCGERDELRNALFAIGWVYLCSWCLLQLLLQQPINSMPILLLLIQVFSGMLYSLHSGPSSKQWVEVALFYYMGMAGHYALGNSNSLATIDVAGAFIGISSHSTVLSGILMFIITYASPLLALLSMVMYISVKSTTCFDASSNIDSGEFLKTMLGFPCLLPLSLNSIFLLGYTVVLILMRNHLFIWSVFSPKYVYVCATTVCVYIGVSIVASTVFYTSWVVRFRRKKDSGRRTSIELTEVKRAAMK